MAIDYFAFPLGAVGGNSYDNRQNGLWLRYTWYFGQHSAKETAALAKRLDDEHIKFAFFHVRYADSNGQLHYHFKNRAKTLNENLHTSSSRVKSIAWIYVGNQHGRGGVDLSRPEVRASLVKEANWLVTSCGFDGVQWDYEICNDGDKGLLLLLDESRAALPRRAAICVASPVWLPQPFTRFGWSKSYFADVAKRSDQIAIMAYDTGTYLPRAYCWLVRKQMSDVAPVVVDANPNCEVLIGLPTYGDGTPSHNPHSENLRMGLKAVREGTASSGDGNSVAGVALFADYTTTSQDWSTYQDLWLKDK